MALQSSPLKYLKILLIIRFVEKYSSYHTRMYRTKTFSIKSISMTLVYYLYFNILIRQKILNVRCTFLIKNFILLNKINNIYSN